jgi:regulator of replication initiation timing
MVTRTITTIEALKELDASIDRIADKVDALRSENNQLKNENSKLKEENAKLKEELKQLKKPKSKLDSSWNSEFEHSNDWRKIYEMGQL